MARAFDDGSSQYLIHATPLATSHPVSLAGWFYIDDVETAQQILMSISDEGGTLDYVALMFDNATDDLFAQSRSSSGIGSAGT